MIIDIILDRKDGEPYSAKDFYNRVMEYGVTFPEIAFPIARAMDEGTEHDVRKELCRYIREQNYNPSICNYINSRKWLE